MKRYTIAAMFVVSVVTIAMGVVSWRSRGQAQLMAAPPPTAEKPQLPHERAIALLQQRKVEEAEALLQSALKEHPDDQSVRVLLGQAVDFDGRPDEAIQIWTDGISGTVADVPLWMQIGTLRARQGTEGPTVTYRRGTVTTAPDRDQAASAEFRTKHLQLAARAFQKAVELAPNDMAAASALARIYDTQNDLPAAIAVWQKIRERDVKNKDSSLGLAAALVKAGQISQATSVLEELVADHPRLARAHALLADSYKAAGREADAEASQRRAQFFKSLPPFTKLNYSAETRETLNELSDRAAVERLCADPSEQATELLAALCWSHPHNELEELAFASLEKRGEPVIPIVRALFDHAQSTCTIRSSARILARHKDPQIFARLVRLLPNDTRVPSFDMDIAGALDDLGDPRAVTPLVQVLNAADRSKSSADPSERFMNDRSMARMRAALALGAFDTAESREALQQGLSHPDLSPYCAAALYRLTREPQYFKRLEASVKGSDKLVAYFSAKYLDRIDTPKARALQDDWKKRAKSD
jgi:Flp pilus assembly protein TadD